MKSLLPSLAAALLTVAALPCPAQQAGPAVGTVTNTAPAAPVPKRAPKPPKPRTPESAVTPQGDGGTNMARFRIRAQDPGIQLLFIGDSITNFWRDRGLTVWKKFYTKYDAANFGVNGEETQSTLGRLINGNLLTGLHPKVVILLIGTNNIGHHADEKAAWVVAGITKIVAVIHQKLPQAKVLLLGILPRDTKDSSNMLRITQVNAAISKLDDGNMTRYLDLTPKLIDADGNAPVALFPGHLHPNAQGYEIIAENIQPLLDQMMQ